MDLGHRQPRSQDRSGLGGTSSPKSTSTASRCATMPRRVRATHEIAGHLHPAARLSLHGTSLRRPCFVGNGLRLVMPAFGAYAGGLNILDVAFEPLFGDDGLRCGCSARRDFTPSRRVCSRDD